MSTLFQPTALVGAITITMGFSTNVSANETPEKAAVNSSLETLVITATRSEEKIENVPARISIIESDILEQSPIASFPDLLKHDAAINMVQSGGMGQLADIYLRGTESDHTLILRDGVRLNNASSGTASLAFIDTTDIKQIEILKGPASVLYGTDAIGGVVQLVSKTPEKTSAFITGEIGEHQTYKSVLGADLAEDGFYAQIRGQRLESNATQVTNQKTDRSETAAFDQKGYSAKLGVEKQKIAASLDYSRNEGKNLYDAYAFDGSLLKQDFENEIVNLRGRAKVTENIELNGRLSQFKDQVEQKDSTDFVHSKTQEAELYGKWNFLPQHSILAGVTQRNLDADILSYGAPYQEDIDSTGYYVQHQFKGEKLNTQAGIRVEDNEKYGTHTVGQVAARYQILPATSIYTNIGTAFKSPTLNELYNAWNGNPELAPEESISYEAGIDQILPLGFKTGLSAYYTEVEDLIGSQNFSQLSNIDKATYKGGELYLAWQQNDLFAKTAYSYVKSENNETHQDLSRRPRQGFTLTTGLQNEIYGISASLIAKSKSKEWDANYKTPGYATVDVNAFWNVNPNVKLFTNIQNIGDVEYETAYQDRSYYYVNGGRLASAGVTFKY
ncbi:MULTISPECIES: TonB-dependent receptor plug domain-containing protein [Acinetobacter]|uniref:TonB-dependent receptor plug domain-containing protein n=1 Tax=Acinetobacter TaxID=469 RepID=UPI00103BAED1|nr:TonB-dependent receptor [Acinetobacter sp. ANC 3781]TCB76521.1 TonB-dependent receptor [Acinetobacter sp. ANC 3781]